MTSEINKQIAELLLKQTYAERMWFADKYHTWVAVILESDGAFPGVQEVADALGDLAEAIIRENK